MKKSQYEIKGKEIIMSNGEIIPLVDTGLEDEAGVMYSEYGDSEDVGCTLPLSVIKAGPEAIGCYLHGNLFGV